METIIYQGQPVQATLVNYLSGTIAAYERPPMQFSRWFYS